MKIVYEKTVLDRIYEAKRDAEKKGRKIEWIEVSEAEMRQLSYDLSCLGVAVSDAKHVRVCGIAVKIVPDSPEYFNRARWRGL